jgi:hypothetical protein
MDEQSKTVSPDNQERGAIKCPDRSFARACRPGKKAGPIQRIRIRSGRIVSGEITGRALLLRER